MVSRVNRAKWGGAMTPSHARSEFALYLTEAAVQWNYMRPRQADIEEERKGRILIYAIDTNVITFWSNPEEVAIRRRQVRESDRIRLGTGQIFHTDTAQLSAAISRGL